MELRRGKERVLLISAAVPSRGRTFHTYWQYLAILCFTLLTRVYALSELNFPIPATVSMLLLVHSLLSFHSACISSCTRT